MPFNTINLLVIKFIKPIEMVGVLMRIFSFSMVSWMGSESPFYFVWAFNTADAIILSWCSILKKESAYILLNIFWILVGVVGMLRASAFSLPDFKITLVQFLAQAATLFN